MVISLSCLSLPLFDDRVNASIGTKKINWNKFSSDQKGGYYMATEVNLSRISLPQAVVECSNPLCNDLMHLKSIDNFYELIISSLLSASDAVCSSNRHCQLGAKQFQVLGWNNEVKSYHDQATGRSAFLDWVKNNKPREGVKFELMRDTTRNFKKNTKKMYYAV